MRLWEIFLLTDSFSVSRLHLFRVRMWSVLMFQLHVLLHFEDLLNKSAESRKLGGQLQMTEMAVTLLFAHPLSCYSIQARPILHIKKWCALSTLKSVFCSTVTSKSPDIKLFYFCCRQTTRLRSMSPRGEKEMTKFDNFPKYYYYFSKHETNSLKCDPNLFQYSLTDSKRFAPKRGWLS